MKRVCEYKPETRGTGRISSFADIIADRLLYFDRPKMNAGSVFREKQAHHVRLRFLLNG